MRSKKPPAEERCGLCGGSGPLQDSHILPEFVYRPLYDDRHKAYIANPLAPQKWKKIQKGIRQKLLCRSCEQLLNDEYEKPFKNLWFDQKILSPLETTDFATLHCGDYARFKLFHLSVLLRADLATLPAFSEVRLGEKHRSRIANLVLNKNAGEPHEYPIVCMAVERPSDRRIWWDFVASPNRGRVGSARIYLITFGGCGWMYVVGSHRDWEIEKNSLRPDGALPVAKFPWVALKRYAPYARFD